MLQGGRRGSINSAGSTAAVAPPGKVLEPGAVEQESRIGERGCDAKTCDTTATVDVASVLNSLLRAYTDACKGDAVVEIPPEFKSKRIIVRIAVRYNKWVTLICAVSAVAFALGSVQEGGVATMRDFLILMRKGGSSGIALRISLSIFVISVLLLVALEITDTVLSFTERKARDRHLSRLREHIKSAYEARQNTDAKAAYLFECLISSYDEIFTNVQGLEAGALEGVQTYKTVKQRHEDLLAAVDNLRQFVSEHVEKAVKAKSDSEALIEENKKLVQERLSSAEAKAAGVFAENCCRITEDLKRAQELSRQRTSELKSLIINFKESIANLIKDVGYTTTRSIERMLQAHHYWISTASRIFAIEGAASVGMCVFFLKAYAHIKDISNTKDMAGAAAEVSRVQRFVASAKVAVQKIRNDRPNPRNRVAEISRIFQKELAPLANVQEKLEAALETKTDLERYDEMCRPVVKNCYEELFGPSRGMFKTVDSYKDFLQSLYAVRADDDVSKLEGEYVTLNQLRDCTPFLMVMQLILRIAINVESIHDLAGKIPDITGQSDIDLANVFRGVWKSSADAAVLDDPQVEEVPTSPEEKLAGAEASRSAS